MRRSVQWTLILGVLLALSFGVAACGGDDDSDSGEQGTTAGTPAEGKKGGKLTALWAGDTDNIDPGITYYQMGTQIIPNTPLNVSPATIRARLETETRRHRQVPMKYTPPASATRAMAPLVSALRRSQKATP